MKCLFFAVLVLAGAALALPALSQWDPPPGYGPRGYGRGYDEGPRGYGRRREYDEGPPAYGRRYQDVGPTGLRCVIDPQFRDVLRSCAAAATFRPGQYCVCQLPNSRQTVPGSIR
jgi:hypothetical protein